jgi:basic membrane protein A
MRGYIFASIPNPQSPGAVRFRRLIHISDGTEHPADGGLLASFEDPMVAWSVAVEWMHTCALQHPDITMACHAAPSENEQEIRLLGHAELYANPREFAVIEPLYSMLSEDQKTLCHDVEPLRLEDGTSRELYLAKIKAIQDSEAIAQNRSAALTAPAPEPKSALKFPWANRRTTILLSLLGVMMYGVQIKQVAILACDLGEHGAKAIETVQGGPKTPRGGYCQNDQECRSEVCHLNRCSQRCGESEPCPHDGRSTCSDGVCVFVTAAKLNNQPVLGFIHIGPVGDHGWTWVHEQSRKEIEAKLGLRTLSKAAVIPPKLPEVVDEFVSAGANIIIATSHDFLDHAKIAATRYPKVNFLVVGGFKHTANLGSYFTRMYQSMWLAGRAAAMVSHSGKLGMVAPVAIPETVRGINAFTLGARDVLPEAKVYVRWMHKWSAPKLEAVATNELIELGVDVIHGGTDTPVPIEIAGEANSKGGFPVMTIGYNAKDTCRFSADHCITSAYFQWTPILEELIEEMRTGEWRPRDYHWSSLTADPHTTSNGLAGYNENRMSLSQIRNQSVALEHLARKETTIFAHPISDNTGQMRTQNKALSDEDLLTMCWFVPGVFDSDTKGQSIDAKVPANCAKVVAQPH